VTTTKPKAVTYKGVPAHVWDYLKGSAKLGERVSAIEWQTDTASHKAGDIELTHCKGDFRTTKAVTYATATVRDRALADEWAAERCCTFEAALGEGRR
jgi:hypothetical protein